MNDALRPFNIRTVVATKMTEANKHLLNEIVNGQDSSFLSTRFILSSYKPFSVMLNAVKHLIMPEQIVRT